jgi:hypothetical protein
MDNNHQIDTIIRAYMAASDNKKAADAVYNQLREELMGILDAEGIKKYNGGFAVVSVCERKKYTYDDNIVRMEEILKAEKKAAEKTGNAHVEDVTRYPRVTLTE